MSWPPDTPDMPFTSTVRIPTEVLDAIVCLTERAASFATEAGRADTGGVGAPSRRGAESLDGRLAAVRP